jgi:uncharacterized protein YndB with AHSA1/START domain
MSEVLSRSVVVERDMPHAPAKVWRALTQGHLLEDWLMPNDFQPVVGHRFTFKTTPMPQWDGIVRGEVLEVELNERLSYSWNTGTGAAALNTRVTFTLTPTAAGVRVRMEQSGFGPQHENNYRGAQYGWTRNLGELERVAGSLS